MDQRDTSTPALERLCRRDRDAVAWLVNEHQPLVLALGQSMGLRGADLEDAAAEVFANVYRAIPRFRGQSLLRTWIYRIAVRTLASFQEKMKWALPRVPEEHGDAAQVAPDQAAATAERNQKIWAAVARLSPREAMAIEMHYRQGMPLEEIAGALDCPVGTVKTLLFRARQRLRDVLSGEENAR